MAVALFTCAAFAASKPAPIAFVTGKTGFKPGDSIVIDEVLASSPKLEVGSTVVVRGHYRLVSAAKANLGLLITHRSDSGPDAIAPSQFAPARGSSGTFELFMRDRL